jgi:hypothetical protein
MRISSVLLSFLLLGCATGQDVYIGDDIVSVIPPDRAVAFLKLTALQEHTNYDCQISDNGIAFPSRPGLPDWGIVPFKRIRVRTVWAEWPPNSARPNGAAQFALQTPPGLGLNRPFVPGPGEQAFVVDTGLAVVAEVYGPLKITSPEWEDIGDRCILHLHPNPGSQGTVPPADPVMRTTVEALVSLGATYKKVAPSDTGINRIYLAVGM